jgi:PAS domain S-box-containing protein
MAAGLAFVGIGALRAASLVNDLVEPPAAPQGGSLVVVLPYLAVAGLLLLLYRLELVHHFHPQERSELVADAALIAVAAGAIVFLILRPAVIEPGQGRAVVLSAVIAAICMAAVAAALALALRIPSPLHAGMLGVMVTFAASGLAFAHDWIRSGYVAGHLSVDLPLGLGMLAMAALLLAEPALAGQTFRGLATKLGRPVLTATAVGMACASLTFVAISEFERAAGVVETSILVAMLCVAITARIVLNQMRGNQADQEVARALDEKENALREADEALVRLRQVHKSLAGSEERLRLLVDVAADGIVELDARRVIRRVNESFCTMLGMSRGEIVGTTWQNLAEEIEGTGGSLATLPETGHAVIPRSDQDLHLEARSSELPGSEPGELLVIRDVTAARVADQTIRSLFKFLQDRDEDRTRLMKRTNAAIEAERNRIARDIHDGPVQGVAGATLSLEAVLIMLQAGGVEEAVSVLTKIREELAEEADNLRRLMSDLRPPVLDERGLVPALDAILSRFGRENDVKTTFSGRSLVEIPEGVETLAYRIVQEALTNASKHAHATEVSVSAEAVAGQLRIEIVDNGLGFDPASAREFLRAGRVGLASMRERTELANGSLLVRSTPGAGTTIVATLPIDVSTPVEAVFS